MRTVTALLRRSGLLRTRTKRLDTYRDAFQANEAVEWLIWTFKVPQETALQIMNTLLANHTIRKARKKREEGSKHAKPDQPLTPPEPPANEKSPSSEPTSPVETTPKKEKAKGKKKGKAATSEPAVFSNDTTWYQFTGPDPDEDTPDPLVVPTPGKPIQLVDVSPLEIARQLTLIEFDIFKKIQLKELSSQAWNTLPLANSSPSPTSPRTPHLATSASAPSLAASLTSPVLSPLSLTSPARQANSPNPLANLFSPSPSLPASPSSSSSESSPTVRSPVLTLPDPVVIASPPVPPATAVLPESPAPNVIAMINRANDVSYWVASEILKTDKLRERTTILRKFILVAHECRKLQNWNGLLSVMVGLNLGSVQRLKKTWTGLSKQILSVFEELSELTASVGNYKNYRAALNEAIESPLSPTSYHGSMVLMPTACIPCLAVILRDLTFLEDGNKNFLESQATMNLINFDKMRMISNTFRQVVKLQARDFRLIRVPEMERLLTDEMTSSIVRDDRQLYKYSYACEESLRAVKSFDSAIAAPTIRKTS
eukprot:TRINITY_DN2499_c0_g1_i3.p1 TRINITY_DN2499_c0_g1~~TRINITY_DN2499_c0_g1_i3.p1  ORF type:complete len:542 (-),score=156.41 TRINITY_DN2499_c0_g1_i3:14-1639(-)